MKRWLTVILLASPVLAQDQSAAARMAAGCGPNEVLFNVKTDKKQHPAGQTERGKALVYFFGDENIDNHGIHIGGLATRWGIDGNWAGATKYKSYFFVSVGAGEHRICTSRQSSFESQTRISAAISLNAEPGNAYYVRLMTPRHQFPDEVALAAVDPAAAQLLIANSAFSVSHPK